MKPNYISFFFLLISFVWISCAAPAKKQGDSSIFLTSTTGLQLDNRLLSADSLVFVFYKNPYGEDSLRYTRYYTQWPVTDTNDISLLLKNFTKPFTKFEKVKKCRSEGKVWCYSKGKIFQTVSFATLCSDCSFVYFIKDGYFFYTPLDTALANRLSLLKKLSKNPEVSKN